MSCTFVVERLGGKQLFDVAGAATGGIREKDLDLGPRPRPDVEGHVEVQDERVGGIQGQASRNRWSKPCGVTENRWRRKGCQIALPHRLPMFPI